MARLTQWIMALAGLLTSASMSSCSRGNENEEPRPPVDTEQRVATPEKDGGVDRLTPADDASADEKPLIASKNWYEFNVSDNRLSIPPKWYELYDVDIEDYKDAVSDDDDFDKRYVPSRASLAKPIASSSKATNRDVDFDGSAFDALKNVDDKFAFDAWKSEVSRVPGGYYGPPPVYKSNDTRKKKQKADRITIKVLPPDVSGSLDKRAVQKVVRSHFSELRACYENEFERDKNVGSGKVTVSWKVDETGAASGVTIKETTLKNKRVEDCLVEAISRWRFPKPTGGVWAHIEYSFDFELQTDD